jgi:hypothetical protein
MPIGKDGRVQKPKTHFANGRQHNWGRDTEAQLRDRAVIAQLYSHGWSCTRISKESKAGHAAIGLSAPLGDTAIRKELGLIRKAWVESALFDFDQHMAVELERIDAIEQKAWESWEKSTQDTQATRRRLNVSQATGTATPVETQIRTETRAGDPRWADVLLKCSERRAKLLGLDAPDRIAIAGQFHHEVWNDNHGALAAARSIVQNPEASRLAHRLLELTVGTGPPESGGVRGVHNTGEVVASTPLDADLLGVDGLDLAAIDALDDLHAAPPREVDAGQSPLPGLVPGPPPRPPGDLGGI